MTDWPSDWPMGILMGHFLDCQLMEEGPGIMDITIIGQVGLCCEECQTGMSLEGSQEAAFVVSDSVLASVSTDDGLKLVN